MDARVPLKPNILQTEKRNPVNFNIMQDAYQDLPESLANSYIASWYGFSIVSLMCKKENYSKLIDTLKQQYGSKEYKFEITPSNKVYYIEDDNHRVLLIADIGTSDIYSISIFGKDIPTTEEAYKIFKKFEHTENQIVVNFNTLSVGSHGKVSEYNTQLKAKDFEDDRNDFYPYLNVEELFRQFTISNENVLVLSGEPGTGKTRAANLYIKWLIQNEDICRAHGVYDSDTSEDDEGANISVCYVKNEELLSLDAFWELLTHRNPALVFLDDSDHSLTSRKNEVTSGTDHNKNKFLSQLLSFTDGVTKNNVKFIITTNLDPESIDTAVLRKGRTFDILKFRKLTPKEAYKIWRTFGYSKKQFSSYFETDEFIPACDLGSAINKELNTSKTGQENKSYVKEHGISILNKTQKNGSEGFFG